MAGGGYPPVMTDPILPESRSGIPAGLLAGLAVTLLTVPGIAARHWVHGGFDAIHSLLTLFLATNLVICYWEICLFFRRDHIERRTEQWSRWRRETGRMPAGAFLSAKIPLRRVLSLTVWADVWSTYAMFDRSYANRRTFGFVADVANGFVTPIPTAILYVAYAWLSVPPVLAGIIGLMVFWQWVYVTSAYWVSFFVAGRQEHITVAERYIFIWGTNSPWVLFALLGIYVSVRLILDGTYAVLGG